MAKGALYWRHKDEKTGKWTYKKVHDSEYKEIVYSQLQQVKRLLQLEEE